MCMQVPLQTATVTPEIESSLPVNSIAQMFTNTVGFGGNKYKYGQSEHTKNP